MKKHKFVLVVGTPAVKGKITNLNKLKNDFDNEAKEKRDELEHDVMNVFRAIQTSEIYKQEYNPQELVSIMVKDLQTRKAAEPEFVKLVVEYLDVADIISIMYHNSLDNVKFMNTINYIEQHEEANKLKLFDKDGSKDALSSVNLTEVGTILLTCLKNIEIKNVHTPASTLQEFFDKSTEKIGEKLVTRQYIHKSEADNIITYAPVVIKYMTENKIERILETNYIDKKDWNAMIEIIHNMRLSKNYEYRIFETDTDTRILSLEAKTMSADELIAFKCLKELFRLKAVGVGNALHISIEATRKAVDIMIESDKNNDKTVAEIYTDSVAKYLIENSLDHMFDTNIISKEHWDAIVKVAHDTRSTIISSSQEKSKGCGGNCNCHDKATNLESVIKDQKPRISLGKDLEERLATYSEDISNGIIKNIEFTMDRIDINHTWWTEDKLQSATMLGMEICDVPEEIIAYDQKYKELYTAIIKRVGEIKQEEKNKEAIKEILPLIKHLTSISVTQDVYRLDHNDEERIHILKERIVSYQLTPGAGASYVLKLLDMVPEYVLAFRAVGGYKQLISLGSKELNKRIADVIVTK